MITVNHISPIHYPYVQAAKNYLENADCNVKDHFVFMKDSCSPLVISWDCHIDTVTSFTIEYATDPDFSDATHITADADCRQIELYNLFKSTKYFVRITAYSDGEPIGEAGSHFSTASLGPRVMRIDGIYNVRDLGGYDTIDGNVTIQGILYRGGSLTPADIYDSCLTESGKKYMSEEMKIKTEIDLRSPSEAGELSESVIPRASLVYIPLGGYSDAFSDSASGKAAYRKLFSALASKDNYPIYYHCTGGADRTGTVSFLLGALLGVNEDTLIKDYEFTSFSVYHMRNVKEGDYAEFFKKFRSALESFDGDTLQKKVENYLLSIGVTEAEIYNIRAIMLDNSAKDFVS